MLRGLLPFDSPDQNEVLKMTLAAKLVLKDIYWDKISIEAKDIVYKLLDPNPKTRITAPEILRHPWTISPANEVILTPTPSGSESSFAAMVRGNTFNEFRNV